MNFMTEMMYLGYETKISKAKQGQYLLAKFMDTESSSVYELYVPGDRLTLITEIGKLEPFKPVKLSLKMSAFNGKPQIDLDGVNVK